MPPLLPVVLAGVALYGAYRWAARQLAEQAKESARRAEASGKTGQPLRDRGTLELDTRSNVYRPKA